MPVHLTDLGHRFGTQPWLFRHLTTDLNPGDMVALTGPSGSGKSTLLGIIAGWISPAEGTVKREAVMKTNWVFQNPHGVTRRSAVDHVAVPLMARGDTTAQADHKARELLADFRLSHVADSPFAALSGGEAQRLMLARALASAPDLLLVDEPTAQLDLTTAREVAETLAVLARNNMIVAIATHDHHIRDECTRVVDLSDFNPQP